jgi:hypothetical protein
MLLLIAILLLLLTPACMLAIHLVRPAFGYQWLVATLGALLAWLLVLLAGLGLPQAAGLFPRGTGLLFAPSPALLADRYSWALALALSTLVVAVMFTAVARARQGNWRSWASSCLLAGLGLVAVLAGNPLTLLLAWAAIDLAELLTLLAQIYSSEAREQIVAAFSARVGGMLLLIWAGVAARQAGVLLSFDQIPPQSSLFLLLAAGLRLGVLPINLPYLQELPLRRGLGVSIRLVPAASSLVLLVRAAMVGIPAGLSWLFYSLASLAALYGAISWVAERDDLAARPFWLLGISSFVIAAAVRAQPAAALAWSLACLLPGGLLFLTHARHRSLLPLLGLGLLGLTGLPFTPAWNGAGLYLPFSPLWQSVPVLFFFLAQCLLLAGYALHAVRPGENLAGMERWVWVIYPLGLALLPFTHFVTGWRSLPEMENLPLTGWLAGPVALGGTALLWAVHNRSSQILAYTAAWQRLYSLAWIYRSIWHLYQSARRYLEWITTFLEGEAGILWALLVLALILSMLSSPGPGG